MSTPSAAPPEPRFVTPVPGTGPSEVLRTPTAAERDPVAFGRRRKRRDTLLRFGTPLLILLSWQLSATIELLDPKFFPAPTKIAGAFVASISSGVLPDALATSTQRILIGYVIGATVGILVGFVLGVIRPLRVALDPVISAVYTVPKLAILPLLLLLFGLGDAPKIILIALAVFFILCISTTAAVMNISASYLEPAQIFGASPLQKFRHVMLPAVLPEIFVALRLTAGTAVLVLVGIEFVQGSAGIGWLIWNSWQLFLTDRMYVGIVSVALLGVVFQTLIKVVGRWAAPWATLNARGDR